LFTVEDGWKLVGTDASGLELRCLAHYLYQYDKGEFRDVLLNGDIHTENQKAFNADTRNDAKTAIYALIYGCSPRKLALTLGRREEEGRELLESYFKRWPQVRKLISDVQRKAKSFGYLVGIDGRKLHVRSQHAALNTLLQSAGAIVMKVALLRFVYLMNESNKNLGHHYKLVANIHDEFQVECWKYMASNVAELAVQSIRDAGRALRFNCPLEGESKIGDNWASTH
jgi:DNA polymerase I-like protein with 3'-5' exonuclease and polymerase domains